MTSPSRGYTPLWTEEAAFAKSIAEMPKDLPVTREYAEHVATRLASDFADVDPHLVGWVALRTLNYLSQVKLGQDLSCEQAWMVLYLSAGHLVRVR